MLPATDTGHSYYSASSFAALMLCPGKKSMEAGRKDKTSVHAAWGTVAHQIADEILSDNRDHVTQNGDVILQDGHNIVVDEEMSAVVGAYVTNVLTMTEGAVWAQAETRTNYAFWLDVDEDKAWGTADYTAFMPDGELQVHDLKTGRGVEVAAEGNEQMMLYAGGKLLELAEMGLEASTVRLVIHQPRLSQHPSEAVMTVAQLEEWLSRAKAAADVEAEAANMFDPAVQAEHQTVQWLETYVHPGEKQCRFCRAKAVCPRLVGLSLDAVFPDNTPAVTADDFDNLTPSKEAIPLTSAERLAKIIGLADLIENWLNACRAEGTSRLLAGAEVPGYKLVAGRAGHRKWSDPVEAENLLKRTALKKDDIYERTLISPTKAAELLETAAVGPRQKKAIEALVTRAEGKPAMAPISDKRPAMQVTPLADQFSTL